MAILKRLFVAIDLPDEIRHRLASLIRSGVDDIPGAVVSPDNWHITLRFVGSATEAQQDRLVYELSGAATHGPFTIGLGEFGTFPRAREASVLWLGIDRGADDLVRLSVSVESAVQAAGFGPEDRPFRPHLTVSRLRPAVNLESFVAMGFRANIEVPVAAMTLFASVFEAGGARYEVVEQFEL